MEFLHNFLNKLKRGESGKENYGQRQDVISREDKSKKYWTKFNAHTMSENFFCDEHRWAFIIERKHDA